MNSFFYILFMNFPHVLRTDRALITITPTKDNLKSTSKEYCNVSVRAQEIQFILVPTVKHYVLISELKHVEHIYDLPNTQRDDINKMKNCRTWVS